MVNTDLNLEEGLNHNRKVTKSPGLIQTGHSVFKNILQKPPKTQMKKS